MNRITLFRTTPRIVMGPGAVARIAQEVKGLNAQKVLLVTDKGVIAAGLTDRIVEALKQSNIAYAVFDAVEPDPRYEIVHGCVEAVSRENADVLVGFGGGSPIDIAKAASVMAANEGPISRYFGVDLVPKSGLPTIMIPTTAGTGSEVISGSGKKIFPGWLKP